MLPWRGERPPPIHRRSSGWVASSLAQSWFDLRQGKHIAQIDWQKRPTATESGQVEAHISAAAMLFPTIGIGSDHVLDCFTHPQRLGGHCIRFGRVNDCFKTEF